MEEPQEPFWDPDEPGIFDDPEAVARADARAIADIEAGRVISHDAMKVWIQARIQGEKPPLPQIGE